MENGWDYLLFQGGKIVPVQESEPSFAGGKEKGRAEVSENIRPGKVNSRVPDDGLPKTVLFPADHRDSRLGHGSRRGRSDPVDEISSREPEACDERGVANYPAFRFSVGPLFRPVNARADRQGWVISVVWENRADRELSRASDWLRVGYF